MKLSAIVTHYENELLAEKIKLLPNQQKALWAIKNCRTPECGEVVAYCPECGLMEKFNHSCGNRSCPQCQNHEATIWLERQKEKHLPVHYFMVTFTIPSELWNLTYYHQKKIYNFLFKSSSEALKELAGKPRYLDGKIGMSGVLHTHKRNLEFHPHIHYVVPGGGINHKKNRWKKAEQNLLVWYVALSRLFRGKFLAQLRQSGFTYSNSLHKKEWVVHCKAVGSGTKAFEYLSRYIYRGVIAEKSIISDRDGKVTFSYIDSQTKEKKTRTLPGAEFLRTILKHVLPKGFRRVRDYGFLHGRAKKTLKFLQLILNVRIQAKEVPRPSFLCPNCGEEMEIMVFHIKQIHTRARGSPMAV